MRRSFGVDMARLLLSLANRGAMSPDEHGTVEYLIDEWNKVDPTFKDRVTFAKWDDVGPGR